VGIGLKRDCLVGPQGSNGSAVLSCGVICNWRKQAWVLKNSFRGISRTKFARKLLNLRLPQALEFTQITALVPFSTATGDYTH